MALALSTAFASAQGCTDSWTGGAGTTSWDTALNWSTRAVPGSSDQVCIGVTGSAATVAIPNETITIAALTVGGSGQSSTLTAGTPNSGFVMLNVSGAVETAAGGTIMFGFGGTLKAATLQNTGTFQVPSTGFGGTIDLGNTTNTGTFAVAGGATLNLAGGSTFANSGTLSNASGALVVSSSGSAATLQLQSGGAVTDTGTGDSIHVAATVALDGGSICGNPLQIGSGDGGTGGTLAFAASPGSGPACGSGVARDQLLIDNVAATISGTIPAGYTVTVGDGGSGYFALALSGNVANDGTFAPGFGGTVSAPAAGDSLTNNGTVSVQPSTYTTALNIPLLNQGQLTFGAATTASLAVGSSWQNASSGTITVPSGVTVSLSSPSNLSASLTQAGIIENGGSLNVGAAVTINGGTICGNGLAIGSGDAAAAARSASPRSPRPGHHARRGRRATTSRS